MIRKVSPVIDQRVSLISFETFSVHQLKEIPDILLSQWPRVSKGHQQDSIYDLPITVKIAVS